MTIAREAALKPHDDRLDQGDILADVPMVAWKNGEASEKRIRALVTSHGCVCEDYERAQELGRSSAAARVLVQVTPLRPATVYKHKVDEIREGRLLDKFFVEGDGVKLQHQVADLTLEQPVPAEVLIGCTKIARLSNRQWHALLVHMAVARFRIAPEKLFRDELLKGGAGGA